MKTLLKFFTVLVFILAFALGSTTAHSSTMLQDSTQGRLFPIAISLQSFQSNPPSPATIYVYFNPFDSTPGSLLGMWTAFTDPYFSSYTIRDYIFGAITPPPLHAGDYIFATSGVNGPLTDSVRQYLLGGGNPKVLLPVVDGDPLQSPNGTPLRIIGFVGFHIDGTDPYRRSYVYGHFNDPPVIDGTPLVSASPDTFYSFNPTATDPDGDTLSFSITNQPFWATLDTSTGALTGVAVPGTYENIQISVSDGGFTSSLPQFTITVTDHPTINFTSVPLNFSNQASGAIEFSANKPATYECKLDDSAFAVCTSPFNYNNLTNGKHTFSVKATFAQGNALTSTFSWTVNTALAASSAILLLQTGQTQCYDTSGTEISCDGTGQDGELLAGVPWPNPRFTDNGNGTISDNLTGLEWVKNANLMQTRDPSFDADINDSAAGDGKVTWQHALDYIKKLNVDNYLGHNDWRLPNAKELESLVNRGQCSATTWLNGQGFTNVPTNTVYWTSSTQTASSIHAWSVFDGYVVGWTKTGNSFVWPVRSGQSSPIPSSALSKTGQTTCYDTSGAIISCNGTGQDGELQIGVAWLNPRFMDNGDQSITDNLTGLIWSKEANPATIGKTWQDALDYVKSLNNSNYLGHNDWRLPNVKELESLVNRELSDTATWLNGQGFTNVQSSKAYWASGTAAFVCERAWLVDLYHGNVNVGTKTYPEYTWPVRGGYIQQKLTVTKSGTGTGSVTLNPGSLAWNGDSGTARIAPGDTVTLAAIPDSGMVFSGWSGDCSGLENCTVTMDATKNVTATFTRTYTVTFTPSGNGTLSGATSQIVNHGGSTTAVTAVASPGYHFANWTDSGGNVTGTANPLTITNVTASQNITANFAKDPYQFIGFKSPASGASVKIGSTVQVIFQLKDALGNYVSNSVATLMLQKYSGSTPIGSPLVATSTKNVGNIFKYDSKKKQYIYYLATKPLTAGTWQLRVSLDDGTVRTINIVLK